MASQNPWYFNKYSIEQGLSQSTATCIIKDRKGFIWIGTQDGLNRFDGYQFKVFKHTKDKQSISGNWITDCAIDRNGEMWLATATSGLSKFNPLDETFTRYNQQNSGLKDDKIWALHVDHNNHLWIGTEAQGLARFNAKRTQFEHFPHSLENKNNSPLTMIRDIFEDTQGQLWLASSAGVKLFNPNLLTYQPANYLRQNPLSIEHKKYLTEPVWAISQDQYNNLWIGTKSGLGIINISDGSLQLINSQNETADKIRHDWVTTIFRDQADQMWIGTYGGGVAIFSDNRKVLSYQQKTLGEPNSLSSNHIMAFYEDKQSNMWIGSDGGGLNYFATARQRFHHQRHDSDNKSSLSHSFVRAITQDSDNYLWVATRKGVNRSLTPFNVLNDDKPINFQRFYHDKADEKSLPVDNVFALHNDNGNIWLATYGGGLSMFDKSTQKFINYTHQEKFPNSISSNYVYAIEQADENNLWVGTNKGLNLFNTRSGTAKHFQHDPADSTSLSQNTIFTILQNEQQRVWVGTRGGLNYLSSDHQTFKHFSTSSISPLTSNMVISLLQEGDNVLWVGTMQGLNKLDIKSGKIKQYTEENGLINSNIFNIQRDLAGYLWLSTNRGLTRFHPKDETFKHFTPEDGLQDNAFILGSSYQNTRGELMFGGVNGFNIFNPNALLVEPTDQSIVFTDFLLVNHSVAIKVANENIKAETTMSLAQSIVHTKEITLDHSQSIFSFEFSSLNYAKPKAQQFAYKLQGFDHDWLISHANKRFATYSNIPAGTYQLKVTPYFPETNKRGAEQVIRINITPAPWHTWWAYSCYGLVILLIVFVLLNMFYKKRKAEQEKQLAYQIAHVKDTLLSNISHEFKTPLTLILGPIERLITTATDVHDRKTLLLIQRNGRRLLTMVEQVLDLRQLQEQKSILPQSQDVKAIIQFMFESFGTIAKGKEIDFVFDDKADKAVYVVMVPDALEKLLGNLLSNAFKYSPAKSSIILTLQIENSELHIKLEDTGFGMHSHDMENIFERYERVCDTQISGYGIGLAIVKEIVQQHQGKIKAESEINRGTCFDIWLPCSSNNQMQSHGDENNVWKEPLYSSADIVPVSDYLARQPTPQLNVDPQALVGLPMVLIIDDNIEIQEYLVQLLSTICICITADNGVKGMEQVLSKVPDIIVCDVMMPEMDGFTFVEQLRNNILICHIPLLLLTARDSRDSKLKGLNLLADDYLTKPFDEQEIQIRVQRLLSLRTLIKHSVSEKIVKTDNDVDSVIKSLSAKDQQFIKDIQIIIEKNYQYHYFTVEKLAKALCMSPRALQIKIKALTDMTPTDYLRIYRLNQAEDLLKTTVLSIGQISELTGFNSQSYFARCFKARFDCGAKEYRLMHQT
jgi:ligand-binding sensor domain-containing protein/signal transduction histidine kinase/CheY-like chemotaxis protein/AraC-like DNA-binding protein